RSEVICVVKLYPVGAITNSRDGVTDIFEKCLPVLEQMIEHNMPLLVLEVSRQTLMGEELTKKHGFVSGRKSNEEEEKVEKAMRQMCGLRLGRRRRRLRSLDGISFNVVISIVGFVQIYHWDG
ncbi:uncharacterized protein A4U43_C10F7040, partial [Asparagus officinalis]